MSKTTKPEKLIDNSVLKCPRGCGKKYSNQVWLEKHIATCKHKKSNLGGAREGAGRPKGTENMDTKERREMLKQFKSRVATNIDKLFNSQLNLATGQTMLFVQIKTRDKKGKVTSTTHERIEDEETIKQFLDEPDSQNDNEHFYYITTKPADNRAIDSLLNRAYGRPQEHIDHTTDGEKIDGPLIYLPAKLPDNYDKIKAGIEKKAGK